MKKFLALAVFLLNLLSLTEVSAQNMTNESMNDCEDDGYSYTTNLPCEGAVMCREKCPNCEAYFDCDELKGLTENYNTDSYTYLAGVRLSNNSTGTNFANEGDAHALEITGTSNGHINYWSWAKYGTTTERNCPVKDFILINKSEYAKEEKKNRRELKCECADCTNTRCGVCM